jgi:phosphoribosylanthranilate isomerase
VGASLSAEVKICGLKTLEHLEAAIAAGASYYGMVFFARSPRNIAPQEAAGISRAGRGRIKSVALTVDAGDAEIDAIIAAADPDMIQLHGAETPARAAEIRQRTGRPLIKAISVEREGDADRAHAYDGAADLILFDAKPPRGMAGALPGGNGLVFDWRLLSPLRGRMRFMLSGGLNPGNVAQAIALTGAAIVDVSSGVETAPGEKDTALIHQFVKASRAAALEAIANG